MSNVVNLEYARTAPRLSGRIVTLPQFPVTRSPCIPIAELNSHVENYSRQYYQGIKDGLLVACFDLTLDGKKVSEMLIGKDVWL